MKFKYFVNSRKFSWTIVGIGFVFTLIVFFFLPSSIPIHFNAGGIADSYGDRIQIFLFPLLQLLILLLTGREKLRYWLTHSKTFLNDIQYNWLVSGLCLLIIFVEFRVLYAAF